MNVEISELGVHLLFGFACAWSSASRPALYSADGPSRGVRRYRRRAGTSRSPRSGYPAGGAGASGTPGHYLPQHLCAQRQPVERVQHDAVRYVGRDVLASRIHSEPLGPWPVRADLALELAGGHRQRRLVGEDGQDLVAERDIAR